MKNTKVANSSLASYIVEMPGLFDRDLCKKIVHSVSDSGLFHYEYSHIKRENYVAELGLADHVVDIGWFDPRLLIEINRKLSVAYAFYFDQIKDTFAHDKTEPMTCEPDIFIRRYGVGGKLISHIDSTVLTALVGLNDDYEGGKLSFWNNELTKNLPSGTLLMLPGNFLYAHEVSAIISGDRYVLVAQYTPPVLKYEKRPCNGGYHRALYGRNGTRLR